MQCVLCVSPFQPFNSMSHGSRSSACTIYVELLYNVSPLTNFKINFSIINELKNLLCHQYCDSLTPLSVCLWISYHLHSNKLQLLYTDHQHHRKHTVVVISQIHAAGLRKSSVPRLVASKYCFANNYRYLNYVFCTSLYLNITTYVYARCHGNNHKNVIIPTPLYQWFQFIWN